MEKEGTPSVSLKKTTLTPKAVIYQKFGAKACYKVEEVQESSLNECPGLAIPQKGPSLYRCCLHLPELSVVSDIFKRKKDAEQSAAEKAVEKLGLHPSSNNPTKQEAWDELVARLSYLFSNEFLSALHPLSGHFRAALQREGCLNGLVSVSVMVIYDSKLTNLCKYINPEAESNSLLVMSNIMGAAAKIPDTVSASEDVLSLRRANPYPPEIRSLVDEGACMPNTCIKAIRVPYLVEKPVELLTLNVSSSRYYLDAIAKELGATDGSKVLISRIIGKASSETRFYYCDPKLYGLNRSSELCSKQALQSEESINARASYFSGQVIYGDAVLASIGYTWKSTDLFYEDVSSQSYYRILINRIPTGIYKLSRAAFLAAELPVLFGSRSNWRGSFPREILSTFCRQHYLSEPVITPVSTALESSEESPGSCKKLKLEGSNKEEKNGGGKEMLDCEGTFRCEVKIFSKSQDLIIQCSPKESFKKQSDAIQNSALKVISWLNSYFKQLDIPVEKLTSIGEKLDILFHPQNFFKAFAFCPSVHKSWQNTGTGYSRLLGSNGINHQHDIQEDDKAFSVKVEGPDSGVSPSPSALVCISYTIYLVTKGECLKELIESNSEFEFEVGIEAVIPRLEAVLTHISVGQSVCFHTELLPQELIFAANGDSEQTQSLLFSRCCSLEYSVTLLRVTEPLEDRMEKALFSPPLSKQRVEYALQHIKESHATYLVDFGCGSGSLLDSLLEYPTSLEKIVGVDISQKALARAAKTLHAKLSTSSKAVVPNSIKSALLFDGSITSFDSRLYGCDIGTCLEVIEHMQEDQACLFGDIVLKSFCPSILIVSTPNYEYNVILQKSTPQNQEEEADEKSQSQSCKFRNHDHKFEWTREQFNQWAFELAKRHNYNVEFSGVGGVAGVEPGFASQIAVFRRVDDIPQMKETAHIYEVIWEWSGGNVPKISENLGTN